MAWGSKIPSYRYFRAISGYLGLGPYPGYRDTNVREKSHRWAVSRLYHERRSLRSGEVDKYIE